MQVDSTTVLEYFLYKLFVQADTIFLCPAQNFWLILFPVKFNTAT